MSSIVMLGLYFAASFKRSCAYSDLLSSLPCANALAVTENVRITDNTSA
jgi:hypothetical protein